MLLVARDEERLRGGRRKRPTAPGAEAGGRAAVLALDVTDRRRRRAHARRRRPSASARLDVLVNNAGAASWRDLDDVPDEDWRAQYELNVMAPLRAMRAAAPAMAERGWGRVVNVCSTAGKRPSAAMPEYSVAKAAELSLSRLFADRYARTRRPRQRDLPRPGRIGDVDGPGRPARPVAGDVAAPTSREEALAEAGAKRPIGRLADPAEIAARDRLPLLRARLLRRRRRLVGRRRHRPSDHLSG